MGVLAALGAGIALAGPGASAAMAVNCAHTDDGIDEATASQLAASVRCLIGKDRAKHDAPKLDSNGKLDEAAGKHNRTMLEDNCWSHECPGEPALGKRIRKTGYLDGARRWRYTEIFGCASTPNNLLDSWLSRQFARRQIREPSWRDIGIAAARDQVGASGCDGGNEATYTVVLAWRRG